MKNTVFDETEKELAKIREKIQETYDFSDGINHLCESRLPSNDQVIKIFRQIIQLIFPGYFGNDCVFKTNLEHWSGFTLDNIYRSLLTQVSHSLRFLDPPFNDEKLIKIEASKIVLGILSAIPTIRQIVKTDVMAAFQGDPAAKSQEEVILSYPSILAVTAYRIAHEFYTRGVPLIPRMISEYTHMKTGIDIHPGATIGQSFFIDHGTGVVIGETCQIGKNVKVYQQVTLGALSFTKDEQGFLIKGLKRHPTIEDDVILYSGCTILGGNTIIGKGSVIGGNVWITASVEPETTVMFDVSKAVYRVRKKDLPKHKDHFLGMGI